uniref:Uncharacterized protein n=1 Tax=Magallana gigas TaxID=29159 RepID=A0A8W8MG80_MAGGI
MQHNKIRMSTDQRTLVLRNSDGSEKRVRCQTEVFNMLLSKETDPSVKSLVLQSLLNEEKSDLPSSFSRSDDQHSALSDTSSFTSASSSRSESHISCENTSNTHVWKAEEEDVLAMNKYYSLKKTLERSC